jgi:competence protein ComEA
VRALEAAGGSTCAADLTTINLAGELQNGEMILVPTRRSPPQARSTPEARGERVININTATAEELAGLPGIGIPTAERIIAARVEKGAFESMDDLKKITGIRKKSLERIQERISFL